MQTSAQRPLETPVSRSWVPRACDRCRKRKARCDEAVPCQNCSTAGVSCTHNAPVLKRGPRPRQPQPDLDSRLRNLEHLISSIPNAGVQGSLSLSTDELNQVRTAAHFSPSSDTSTPDAAGLGAPTSMDMSWMGGLSFGNGTGSSGVLTEGSGELAGRMGELNGLEGEPLLLGALAGAGDEMFLPSQGGQSMGSVSSGSGGGAGGSNLYGKAGSGYGRDMLYRDSSGQTKWLGPSSGMPLLDRLKTVHPTPAPSGLSLAEEWMSLSAAIGMPVDSQQLPGPSQPFSSRSDVASQEEDEAEALWMRLLSVCPQDLVDHLVRAYFTISHLLYPILHAPAFMDQYSSPSSRKNRSFVALVLSICCLSSRYTQDPRLPGASTGLFDLAQQVVSTLASERMDLELVQALFNMSVVQEGTSRPALLWSYLSQAVSGAIELGLHRRTDEYSSFSAIDVEVRKRTIWAIYAQDIKASCTSGRPPILRLADLDVEECSAVDDVYISAQSGIGVQPTDRPSVMAGFVCAVRLHMILEKTTTEQSETRPFISLLRPPISQPPQDELPLLDHVTDGVPGDWVYTPATVADPDSVRFFQKTRVFALQNFIRLLIARHRFSEMLERTRNGSASMADIQPILTQITQSALGIIGTYCAIDARGRLGFFGAHAIAQLSQAGVGLIGVILHLRTQPGGGDDVSHLAMQGLPAVIQVLRQLGKRRAAGSRSAELLAEFCRACRLGIFTGAEPIEDSGDAAPVEVPMLQSLPRRSSASLPSADLPLSAGAFEDWLEMAFSDSADIWGVPPPT